MRELTKREYWYIFRGLDLIQDEYEKNLNSLDSELRDIIHKRVGEIYRLKEEFVKEERDAV